MKNILENFLKFEIKYYCAKPCRR